MKVINPLKTPFGRGKFSPVKDARYRQWDDAFEVEFADGLSFLEPHKTIRKANRISSKATVSRVEFDQEYGMGSSCTTTTVKLPKFHGRSSENSPRISNGWRPHGDSNPGSHRERVVS